MSSLARADALKPLENDTGWEGDEPLPLLFYSANRPVDSGVAILPAGAVPDLHTLGNPLGDTAAPLFLTDPLGCSFSRTQKLPVLIVSLMGFVLSMEIDTSACVFEDASRKV